MGVLVIYLGNITLILPFAGIVLAKNAYALKLETEFMIFGLISTPPESITSPKQILK